MKSLLTNKFCKQFKTTKKYANQVFDFFVEEISRCLKSGKKINLKGIGTFRMVKKDRTFYNPFSGKKMKIKGYKWVQFRQSSLLKKK